MDASRNLGDAYEGFAKRKFVYDIFGVTIEEFEGWGNLFDNKAAITPVEKYPVEIAMICPLCWQRQMIIIQATYGNIEHCVDDGNRSEEDFGDLDETLKYMGLQAKETRNHNCPAIAVLSQWCARVRGDGGACGHAGTK